MNKKIFVIITVILLAIAGGVTFLLTEKDSNRSKNRMPNPTVASPETKESKPASSQSSVGTYVEYKEGAIENAAGTKILFFHAPWCPQCRAIESDIMQKGVPDGVTIIKVDYDTNQALRQKYGVTIQTTLVKVDDNGNLIEKYVAYDDPTLDSIKENLL